MNMQLLLASCEYSLHLPLDWTSAGIAAGGLSFAADVDMGATVSGLARWTGTEGFVELMLLIS